MVRFFEQDLLVLTFRKLLRELFSASGHFPKLVTLYVELVLSSRETFAITSLMRFAPMKSSVLLFVPGCLDHCSSSLYDFPKNISFIKQGVQIGAAGPIFVFDKYTQERPLLEKVCLLTVDKNPKYATFTPMFSFFFYILPHADRLGKL